MILGLTGLKGSGKDTAAKYLVEKHGWVNVKFADTLKNMIRLMLSEAQYSKEMIERYVEGDLKETPLGGVFGTRDCRHLMVTLGTEWGRDLVSPNIWIDIARAKIEGHIANGKNVVITDLRFANELALLKSMDAITARVERGLTNTSNHPSETFISQMDVGYILQNNKTIEHLHSAIARLVDFAK